jgi:hypothetical protein
MGFFVGLLLSLTDLAFAVVNRMRDNRYWSDERPATSFRYVSARHL